MRDMLVSRTSDAREGVSRWGPVQHLPVNRNGAAAPAHWLLRHSGSLTGRSISSYVGTWLLSSHDSRAAPQTVQTASPVCGTKNFSSVRLYTAPQLHCTIVAVPGICASDHRFSSPELCHNRTDPLPHPAATGLRRYHPIPLRVVVVTERTTASGHFRTSMHSTAMSAFAQ